MSTVCSQSANPDGSTQSNQVDLMDERAPLDPLNLRDKQMEEEDVLFWEEQKVQEQNQDAQWGEWGDDLEDEELRKCHYGSSSG